MLTLIFISSALNSIYANTQGGIVNVMVIA